MPKPWSLFDTSTWEGEEAAPPGGYVTPGTVPFASQAMGLINPLLAPLGQAMGIDKQLLQGLIGQQLFSSQGAWNRSTNYSNIAMNRMDRTSTDAIRNSSTAITEEFKIRMIEGMSRSVGGPGDTASAKGIYSKGMMDPRYLAADFMAGQYGLPAMARRAESTYMGMGGYALTPMMNAAGEFVDPRRSTAVQNRLDAVQNALTGAGGVMSTFAKEGPSKWGGLKGGDIGYLFDQAAKSSGGFAGQDTAKITENVKNMSRAMGTLKELFNKDVPELMRELKQTFGHDPFAAYGGATVNSMVKQMKHSARLAGVTVDSVMQMSQISEGYSSSLGAGRAGGGMTAATYATQMIGTNVGSEKFVNMDLYRSTVLKQVTGAQQSPLAKAISGARALFKGTDAEFEAKLGGMKEVNINNLASMLSEGGKKVTASDVRAASFSDKAREFRSTSDIGVDQALRHTEQRLGRKTEVQMNSILRNQGLKTVAGLDFSTQSAEEIVNKIAAANDKPREVIEGLVGNTLDSMARRLGFEGKEAYQKFKVQRQERKALAEEAKRRTEFEKNVEETLGTSQFGFTGIGEALMSADKGDRTSKYLMSAIGLTDKDIAGSGMGLGGVRTKLQSSMKGLGDYYDQRKKQAMDKGDFNEMNKIDEEQKRISTDLMSSKDEMGQDISKEDKLAFINEKDKAKAVENWKREHTKEGRKKDLVEKAKGLAGFAGMGKIDKETNEKVKGRAAQLLALKDVLGEDFAKKFGEKDLFKNMGEEGQKDMQSRISNAIAGLKPEDQEKVNKKIEANQKALGGGAGGKQTVEGMLADIVKMLTTWFSNNGTISKEANLVIPGD